MSKFVSSLLGAAALVGSLSAAQFALGGSLTGSTTAVAAVAQSSTVNRAAKSDRLAAISPMRANTVVTRVGAESTSVAMRVPSAVLQTGGKLSRRPVACEAPASVLTEIAQQMESGRCVT